MQKIFVFLLFFDAFSMASINQTSLGQIESNAIVIFMYAILEISLGLGRG
jgi:hypothetical protein